jgi:hypothetical protein
VKLNNGRTKEHDNATQYNAQGVAGSTAMQRSMPGVAGLVNIQRCLKSGTFENLILAKLASKNRMPDFMRPGFGSDSEHLHRAAEFLAQIPKSMPRVASGLAGPKFRATHVWASSQSSCFPTAHDGNCTQNSWRENLPDSAEHDSRAVLGFPQWMPRKQLLANSILRTRAVFVLPFLLAT